MAVLAPVRTHCMHKIQLVCALHQNDHIPSLQRVLGTEDHRMQSLTGTAQYIDRRVKGLLRAVEVDQLTLEDRKTIRQIKLACNEIKLDVRDYEYAETRLEQQKWAKITAHNILALENLLLRLGDIFGPADIAELGAQLETLREATT